MGKTRCHSPLQSPVSWKRFITTTGHPLSYSAFAQRWMYQTLYGMESNSADVFLHPHTEGTRNRLLLSGRMISGQLQVPGHLIVGHEAWKNTQMSFCTFTWNRRTKRLTWDDKKCKPINVCVFTKCTSTTANCPSSLEGAFFSRPIDLQGKKRLASEIIFKCTLALNALLFIFLSCKYL